MMEEEKIRRIVSSVNAKQDQAWSGLNSAKEPVQQYLKIRHLWQSGTDVATDCAFQQVYCNFYQLRFRRADSKNIVRAYFYLLQDHRNSLVNDQLKVVLLKTLEEMTSRIELSFVSKLCHTINPDEGIYDSIVFKTLGLPVRPSMLRSLDEKITFGLSQLKRIDFFYQYVLSHHLMDELLLKFDERFKPLGLSISNVKKIDFILWQIRN